MNTTTKLIKVCEKFKKNNCEKCGEYCVTFDDGMPFIDILYESLQDISVIMLQNSINKKKLIVYNSDSNKIYVDNMIVYFDEKNEIVRITAYSLYDKLIIVYKDKGELN